MSNIDLAQRVIAGVHALGVTEFCVCSGSRNAPLLAVLGASEVRLYSFVDERSAAFFALGRVKLTERPVAVVTTSGTAVAELLPAAIEAFYSGLPLVLITADRPAKYRGSGAPQAIEQETMFGPYAARSSSHWDGMSPLHLNVEFDEPLIDAPIAPFEALPPATPRFDPQRGWASSEPRIDFRRPVVVIAELRSYDRDRVRDFALRLNAPVFAEALSGLREEAKLAAQLITSGERILRRGNFDGVVRIGSVPTSRFWRDLDESLAALPVVSFSALPFRGLARGEVWPLDALDRVEVAARDADASFFDLDRSQCQRFESILDREPQSELAMVRALSRDVADGTRVYLGNSLPIREWDLAAVREPRGLVIAANRGANGIDGQLSTFFGQCEPAVDNLAVLGDLTALYDLNAPWIVPQLDRGTRFRIVVVNNRGGRIFERVASLRGLDPESRARVIDNAHDLRFAAWSEMFGISDFVAELRPDNDASRRVWAEYEALWA